MVALDSYGGLTEFGLFVRPELADMLDGLPQADLEERYLKHGTVVVHGKDHGLFQATKVRGSANAREIFFAPSEKSSSKSFSIRPSELYSSGDSGNISHVFMNVIGALFAPRTGEDDPPSTLLFKVVSLVAAKEAKVMETVTLRTMLGGVAIGEALSVRAAEFFLSYVPKSALDARAAALASRGAGGGGESEMMGFVDMSTEYPELFKSLQALGAGGAVQYSAAEIAAYATVALEGVVGHEKGVDDGGLRPAAGYAAARSGEELRQSLQVEAGRDHEAAERADQVKGDNGRQLITRGHNGAQPGHRLHRLVGCQAGATTNSGEGGGHRESYWVGARHAPDSAAGGAHRPVGD